MTSKLTYFAFAALLIFASCNKSQTLNNNDEDGLATFSADSIRLHVSELSNDSMLGRKPFTEGETKTVAYLQKEFKQAGLEPGNGGSYLQEVPMVNIKTTADPLMKVSTPKGNFDLKGFEDYVI